MDQIKATGIKMEWHCLGAVAVATGLAASSAHAACVDTTEPCQFEQGNYEIVVPEGDSTNRPAVIYLHGYGGSGNGVLKNRSMVQALIERGYVVVAPNGERRAPNRGASWNFYPGWDGRDELAYFRELLRDVETRFNVDPELTIMAGFSAGAFMVNYLACAEPDLFAAYAPIAGGFWRPQPTRCEGPVRLHHTHGWADTVVPLEGRYLRNRTWQQGDIYAGLELWRETLGCDTHAPGRSWRRDRDLLRQWDCGEGAEITFSLHPGGHTVPKGWAAAVTDWFEKANPSQ
ncbi:alpha/beta hydrolase family esterase [Tritonibacter aquimaris]|nr:PHB depolymerase family esterase [Tritonibacter aquimaris]